MPSNPERPQSNFIIKIKSLKSFLLHFFHSSKVKIKTGYKKLVYKIKHLDRNNPHDRLLVALALIFALILIWFMVSKFVQIIKNAQGPPPIPVEMATVKTDNLIISLDSIGTLKAYQDIVIKAEIPGRVFQIHFKDGDSVEVDTPLVILEHSIQEAALKQAQANFRLSEIQFNRTETLFRQAAVSESDRDQALAQLQNNEALVNSAEATLAKMIITAPFKGFIGITNVDIGDFLNAGAEIVTLVQPDPIYADFRVPEIFLEQVHVNQEIEVTTDALPNRKFTGTIEALDPKIDEKSHSIFVRGKIANPEFILKPGLFVMIKLILAKHENAMIIPDTALMPIQNKQFVFLVENNRAKLTEVTIGVRQNSQVEILSGLKPGDIVITAGQMKVQPNARVMQLQTENGTLP